MSSSSSTLSPSQSLYIAGGAVLGVGVGIGISLFSSEDMRRAFHHLKNLNKPAKYKLHVYDHCPFCIRTELALGWLGIDYQRIVYGYGDMEGPKVLTGKKMLPVLEFVDESGSTTFMPESLDIVHYLDLLEGPKNSLFPPKAREDVDDWLERFCAALSILSRPRIIQMPVKDWANESDIAYARQKYEGKGFDYADALQKTDEYIAKVNTLLEEFEGLVFSSSSLSRYGKSMDDIYVLPHLRTLTCVKGIKWPSKTLCYLKRSFYSSKADLYLKHAC